MKANHFLIILTSFMLLAGCDVRYSEHKMEPPTSIDEIDQERWLVYFDKQIRSSPRKSENYYRKALILNSQGETNDALVMARRATALSPDNLNYRYLLANLLLLDGNYAAGLKEARLAESYGNTKPSMNQILGALYMKVGELDKSNEYLKKALDQDPLNDKSHYYNGLLLLAKGDTLLAEEAILRSLELNYSPAAIQVLVEISMFKREFGTAFLYLNQILKTDSLNQLLLSKKADLYRLSGKTDSARIILNHLVQLDPLNPDYHQRLGQIHFSLGMTRVDSAMFYYNKVLQLDQKNTEALLTLARINDRRGFHSLAIDFYKQILVIDSTFQVAIDELDRLNSKVAYLQRLRRERESMQNLQEIQLRPLPKPQL